MCQVDCQLRQLVSSQVKFVEHQCKFFRFRSQHILDLAQMILDSRWVFAIWIVVMRLQLWIVPKNLVFKTINFQINLKKCLPNFIWSLNFKKSNHFLLSHWVFFVIQAYWIHLYRTWPNHICLLTCKNPDLNAELFKGVHSTEPKQVLLEPQLLFSVHRHW